MPASHLVFVGLVTPIAGIVGAVMWPKIAQRWSLSNLKTLCLLVHFSLLGAEFYLTSAINLGDSNFTGPTVRLSWLPIRVPKRYCAVWRLNYGSRNLPCCHLFW